MWRTWPTWRRRWRAFITNRRIIAAEKLFAAHAKLRSAALEIADASDEGSFTAELQKLAGEAMTLASVTEIVAHAVRDAATANSM